MIPYFKENDLKMFLKYLSNTNVYFEFGSGGSTYQANISDNIKRIYSVESDKEWQNKLKKIIKKKTYYFFIMKCFLKRILGEVLEKNVVIYKKKIKVITLNI